MSIAVGTILSFFFIIIPNIVFRRFYFGGPFAPEFYKPNFYEIFINSIIPGVIFQVSFYHIVTKIFNIDPKFSNIVQFFYSKNYVLDLPKLANELSWFSLYNISLWLFVLTIGFTSRFIVRKFWIDRKLKILRFNNTWHYLFSGEYLDFPLIKGSSKNWLATHVDIVTKDGSVIVIYSGLIEDYIVSKGTCELQSVQLKGLSHKIIDYSTGEKKEIESDKDDNLRKIIPMKSIESIHISYLLKESQLKKTEIILSP